MTASLDVLISLCLHPVAYPEAQDQVGGLVEVAGLELDGENRAEVGKQ